MKRWLAGLHTLVVEMPIIACCTAPESKVIKRACLRAPYLSILSYRDVAAAAGLGDAARGAVGARGGRVVVGGGAWAHGGPPLSVSVACGPRIARRERAGARDWRIGAHFVAERAFLN